MSKQVTVYSALLAAALVGSYLSWTRDKAPEAGDTVIALDIEAEDIEKVVYTSEELDLTLTQRSDDAGSYIWVESTQRKEKRAAPPDPHGHGDDGHGHGDEEPHEEGEEGPAEEGEEPPAEPEHEALAEIVVTDKSFKSGSAGEKLLDGLAPLEAKRRLGALAGEKLAELELTEPEASLTIHRAGKDARTFELGGEAYGTRDRYLRDAESGEVYLVDDELIRPLKRGATSLPDRELLGVEEADMVSLTVISALSGEIGLERHNRDDEDAAYWSNAGEDARNETAETWLTKALRLKSAGYVQPEAVPTGLESAFAIMVTAEVDGEETRVDLEVKRGVDEEGKEAWYASSTYTREMVELHRSPASQAAEDLETVFEAGEE